MPVLGKVDLSYKAFTFPCEKVDLPHKANCGCFLRKINFPPQTIL